jgi:hypothetical protein
MRCGVARWMLMCVSGDPNPGIPAFSWFPDGQSLRPWCRARKYCGSAEVASVGLAHAGYIAAGGGRVYTVFDLSAN